MSAVVHLLLRLLWEVLPFYAAFLGGAWWMYRRQRRQIRLIAAENLRLHRANADLADDLFDHLLHDDPDDDPVFLFDEDFPCHLDAASSQTMRPAFPEMN